VAEKPLNRWSESFVLQIPSVDAQHKGLFDLAYELDCALDAGCERAVLGRTIERLKQYCQHHFNTEERLMHQYAYPGLHNHMLQHDDFARAVIEFEGQEESAPQALSLRVSSFLKDWLADHIAVEDRRFAPFVLGETTRQSAKSTGVPMLLESQAAASQPDTAMCARVADILVKQCPHPLGLANSLDQTRSVLEEMKAQQLAPAIFVVNTYGAKDILRELDALMEDKPVLYLRRALFAGQSGLLDQVNLASPGMVTATVELRKMKPRLTSMWFYGGKNAEAIAIQAAEALGAFLKTGDFRQIERTRSAV